MKQYASDLVVHSQSSFHLAPGVVARTGAIAVAALVLAPLAGLAARRRWSAFVLGGTVLVLALELLSFVFPHFSDLVSLVAVEARGRLRAVRIRARRRRCGARALRARARPTGRARRRDRAAGRVSRRLRAALRAGGPTLATWVALFGGIAALVAGAFLRGRAESPGPLAAFAVLLFVVPVAAHGFSHWDKVTTQDLDALTPGLVHFLRHDVPHGSVVFADLETSYRISAYAPVYVANAPPTHVADTKANRPYARRNDLRTFMETADLAIPRRYGAQWLVLRRNERVPAGLRPRYRDDTFTVFAL